VDPKSGPKKKDPETRTLKVVPKSGSKKWNLKTNPKDEPKGGTKK
jgi:hypothetical protein